jgi:hypothetical protein
MDIFWEIIKILVPSLVVFFTAYYSIKLLTDKDKYQKALKFRSQTNKDIVFLRLQAYERMIILMERISPSNLILRLDKTGLSASEFHLDLLTTIRAEFDHNIAQQLYVSDAAWQIVCDAKEEIVKTINLAKEQLPDEENALNFSKAILEKYYQSSHPALKAINVLKEEARKLF